MMGDREKCIQAQMDEYLSKPLNANLMLQTILKCATLGGKLLERNAHRSGAPNPPPPPRGGPPATRGMGGSPAGGGPQSAKGSPAGAKGHRPRPSMEQRAFTSHPRNEGAESPMLIAEQQDPLHAVRLSLSVAYCGTMLTGVVLVTAASSQRLG